MWPFRLGASLGGVRKKQKGKKNQLTAESDSVAFAVTPMNTPKLLSITAILALALTGANSHAAAPAAPKPDAIKVTAPKATYVANGAGTIDLTKVFASTSKAPLSSYTFTPSGNVQIVGTTAKITGAGSATINAVLNTEPAGYIGNPTASSTFVIAQAKAPAFTATANDLKPVYSPGKTIKITPGSLPTDFSSGAVTYTTTGPIQVDTSGNATITGAGAITVTVTAPSSVNYAAPKPVVLKVAAALGVPSLSVNVPSQVPAGTLDLSSYAARTPIDPLNNGAITYTTKSKGVTIAGSTVTLATNSIGAVSITAAQAATANYAAIKAVVINFTVTAGKVNDTINPVTLVTQSAPGASYSLPTATAASGLTVTATATGAGSVAGGKVTPSGEGTITITFSTAGDAGHNAATLVKTIIAHKVGNLYTFSAQ
jgi:hypothetical protein